MTKQELVMQLNDYCKRFSSNANLALLTKLVSGTPEDDPDFAKALKDETADQIIDLLVDSYTTEDLIDWLKKNNWDVFHNYRFAEIDYLSDYWDIEDMKENSKAFYQGEPDCLLYNEDTGVYVISW